jgi:L-glyceraldehyde 3-phosphate reductase
LDNYTAADERYGSMKYNRLGKSGVQVSGLSLGFWHNFGEESVYANSRAMVRRAFDLGITHFDLANNYGIPGGSAEHTFGQIMKADMAPYRDEMLISTKAGYYMWPGPYGDWGSKKYLISSLDQSLKRLGLEYVDIFYSHRPDPNTPLEETMDALATAVRSGKALYVGISNYKAEATEQAAKLLQGMGIHCLVHQPSYSILNRWVEDGLLDVTDRLGIGVVAFSPLAQGLLTDKYLDGIPEDSRAMRDGRFLKPSSITPEKVAMLRKLNDIAAARGQSLAQMALAWVLRDGKVQSCLIGASRPAQIDENVKALDNIVFSDEERRVIDGIVSSGVAK